MESNNWKEKFKQIRSFHGWGMSEAADVSLLAEQAYQQGKDEGYASATDHAFKYQELIRHEERQRILGIVEEMKNPTHNGGYDKIYNYALESLKTRIQE